MISYRSWGLGSSGAALAIVLAASGCGGDDDSTSGGGARTGKAGTGGKSQAGGAGKAQAGSGGRQGTGGTAGSANLTGGSGGTAGNTSGGKAGTDPGGKGGTGAAGTSGKAGGGTSGKGGAGKGGGGSSAGGASGEGGEGGASGQGASGEGGASAGASGAGGSPECASPSDCNDDDACSVDTCDSGGVCAHAAVLEDDSNPCTTDDCAPSTGVSHTPASGAACTLTGGGTGVCSTGTCVASVPACGNNAVDPSEDCDGGNVTDLDGCNSKCQSEVSAGPALALALVDNGYTGTLASMTCVDLAVVTKADGLVDSVKVQVGISHTWVGDLVLKVVSPTGTVVTLMSRPGFTETADNGVEDGGDNSELAIAYPINFVDGGAKSAENMGNTLADTLVVCKDDAACVYAPAAGAATAGTLSAFVGQVAAGTWRFCAADAVALDVGTLDFVRLSVVQ